DRRGRPVLVVLLVLLLASAAAALKVPWGTGVNVNARRPRPLLPSRARQVKEFALADTQGQLHTLLEWRERKGVVLFFLALDCPIVDGYAPEIRRLAARYDAQGIAFYGVHSHPGVTSAAAARHAAAFGLSFPILLDPSQVVAGEAGVRRTSEV